MKKAPAVSDDTPPALPVVDAPPTAETAGEPSALPATGAPPSIEPPSEHALPPPPPPPPAVDGVEIPPSGDAAMELVIARPPSAPSPAAAPAAPTSAPAAAKPLSPVLVSLAAAVVLGGASAAIGYHFLHAAPAARPEAQSPAAPAPAATPAAPSAPAAVPPLPASPPAQATFTPEPVTVAGAPPAPATPSPVEKIPPIEADVASEAAWTFRGLAFDLMTGHPVFAAKVTLLDSKGETAGETETGTDGRYTLRVPPGDAQGYTLKIGHTDYLARCIDQGENTQALRQATPDERQVLMHTTNGRPWIGDAKKVSVHDLALIPINSSGQ